MHILGVIPTVSGDVWTKASFEYPELYDAAEETAKELGWYVDGAVVGQGLAKIPPIKHRAGAGVLLWWSTGYWSTLQHVVLQSHCLIVMSKYANDPASTSFVFYYSFVPGGAGQNEMVEVKADEWRAGSGSWSRARDRPGSGDGAAVAVPGSPASIPSIPSPGFPSTPTSSSSTPSFSSPTSSTSGPTPASSSSTSSSSSSSTAVTSQRISWREIQGRWLRQARLAAKAVAGAAIAETGESTGEVLGERVGQAIGRALGGESGSSVGGVIGQQLGGRIGEQVASAMGRQSQDGNTSSGCSSSSTAPAQPSNSSSSAAGPVSGSGTAFCAPMTFYQRMENEDNATQILHGPWSHRYIYMSKMKAAKDGMELSAEEEQLFWRELQEAKRKEIASWCDNDSFEVRYRKECSIKPQSSRWVNRWELRLVDGCQTWSVKCRLCPRGYGDVQEKTLHTRSPTAQRTAQRLLVSTSSVMG